MVNIGLIINRELANNETFYLPGLGTFKKEYVPAYFNESEQRFTPPSHVLHFTTPAIDRNKMTEYLTGFQDVSLVESQDTAVRIIKQLEDILADKDALASKKEETEIEGLGILSFNQQDELVIRPTPDPTEFDPFAPIAEAETLSPREQRKPKAAVDSVPPAEIAPAEEEGIPAVGRVPEEQVTEETTAESEEEASPSTEPVVPANENRQEPLTEVPVEPAEETKSDIDVPEEQITPEATAQSEEETFGTAQNVNTAEVPVEPAADNELDPIAQEGSSKRWLWPVIGVALCVLIAGVWYLNPSTPVQESSLHAEPKSEAQPSNSNETIDTTGTAATTAAATTTAVDTSASGLPTDGPAPLADETPSAENKEIVRRSTGRYEVIIAAFETLEEAKEYVAITNAKGYNVYILQNNRAGNMKKISYASYNTPEEASAALANVRNELASEAWLWENKNYNNHN